MISAGVDAGDVDYYEAHGGASQLGDPIELHAAGAVYGEQRTPDKPLYVGSVKANVGHTEESGGCRQHYQGRAVDEERCCSETAELR